MSAESPFVTVPTAAGESLGETGFIAPTRLPTAVSSETPYEVDPYADMRAALSPEHALLGAHEITRIVGRRPSVVALHAMLTSPAPQQSVLAVLLGSAGRRSIRLNATDVPIPAYLRLLSRLCHEAAEHSDEEVADNRAPPPPIRDLSLGSRGPDVLAVQQALNRRMAAGLVADSALGPRTRAAIVTFQRRYGLQVDGIVGRQTRLALFPLVGLTVHAVGTFGGRAERPPVMSSEDPSPDQFPLATLFESWRQALPNNNLWDGPLDSFRRPELNLDLPIPPLLTAPLLNIPGMQLDSRQAQPGLQFNTKPLWQSRRGSANPSLSLVLALQSVLALNKQNTEHLEVAEGFQLGVPLLAQTSDGHDVNLQWFAQATWVDPFWQRGKWHLVQPFAQVSAQFDLKTGGPTLGAGLFPVNIAFDLVKDKVSLFGQGGVVAGWDIEGQRAEIGLQGIGGVNITLGGK